MISTITSITIHHKDDSPVFGESATVVSIQDEGSVVFFKVSQSTDENQGYVMLELEELKAYIERPNS